MADVDREVGQVGVQQQVGVDALQDVVVEERGGGLAHDDVLAHDLVVLHLRHDAELHQQLVGEREVGVDLELLGVALGEELEDRVVDAAHVHLVDDVQRPDQRGGLVRDLLLHLQQLRVVPAAGRVAQPALRREQPHVQTFVEPECVQILDQADA